MADYKIELGVSLNSTDFDGLKKKINSLEADPIKIKLDNTAIDTQVAKIKKELESLSETKGLKLDTSVLEASLTDIKSNITEIKNLLGSLGSGTSTKGLVASINQIGTALDKVSVKFDELQADLSALAKKDFGINFNFKIGDTNPAQTMTKYGQAVIREAVPALQKQVDYLKNVISQTKDADRALENYLVKLYKGYDGLEVKTNLERQMLGVGGVTKNTQMMAYEKYIGYLKEVASLNNIDLSGFNAKFSQSANKVVDDTTKIQTGAKQTEEQLEQMGNTLKQVFGSGVDAERLSTQLDSIVTDLSEIKTALQGLSSGTSLDGLTQSFNKLSEALDKVIANAGDFKNAITGATSGTSGASGIAQNVEKVGIAADKSENEVKELKNALNGMGVNSDTATISKEIENLGIKVQKVTKIINDDNSFSIKVTGVKELNDGLEQTISLVQRFNSQGIAEGSTQTFTDNIKKADDALLKLKANADGLSSSASMTKVEKQYNSTYSSLKQLAEASVGVKQSFVNLTGAYNELTSAQQSYKNIMSQSDATDEQKIDAMNRLINANKKYQNALATTNNLIADNAGAEKEAAEAVKLKQSRDDLSSEMSLWLQKNTAAARQFGTEIQKLQVQVKSADSKKLDNLKAQFTSIKREAELAGKTGLTFGDRLKEKFTQFSAYFSIASVFMYATQAMRGMFEQVKAIDTAMTELKKVTDETDASYSRFLTNAASRAKEIGTTIDGLVESTADFARLGYSFEDAQGLAEVANIYAVVGDEIENVEDASQSLISTMAAFKDEMNGMSDSGFALSIVDKFNEVDILAS